MLVKRNWRGMRMPNPRTCNNINCENLECDMSGFTCTVTGLAPEHSGDVCVQKSLVGLRDNVKNASIGDLIKLIACRRGVRAIDVRDGDTITAYYDSKMIIIPNHQIE